MKLWLDDVRKPPDDTWTWAKTAGEAAEHVVQTLERDEYITEMSLDHDLGREIAPRNRIAYLRGVRGELSGLVFCEWLLTHVRERIDAGTVEPGVLLPALVTVHSWNNFGAKRMQQVLERTGFQVNVRPYTVSR